MKQALVIAVFWLGLALNFEASAAEPPRCQVVAQTSGSQSVGTDGQKVELSGLANVERMCFGSTPEESAFASGGGSGGEARCDTRPFGPLAAVEEVWAAVTAARDATPTEPEVTIDVIQDPSARWRDQVIESPWYRVVGLTAQVKYLVSCPGELTVERWMNVTPDGAGRAVAQVTTADLLPSLQAQVIRQLPTPVPRIGPADEDAHGWTYVNNRTFFWVDQAPGQWEVVSGSTSAGGISVSVQAEPVRLVVDPGDGAEAVICNGAPTAVTKSAYRPNIQGCAYVYPNSSSIAPNGQTYPVTATIVWHASWSASTGEGGDLGFVSTTSAVRDLAVAEVQAIVTTHTD